MSCAAVFSGNFAQLRTCRSETSCKSGIDRLLGDGDSATSSWETASIANEPCSLPLPYDITLGEYIVKAGIYYWETAKGLSVWDEKRRRVSEDTVLLGSVRVAELGDYGGMDPRHQSSGYLRAP